MARRLPKFPLKMANGENVYSIEDLRENADINSMVTYFLNGKILKWCKAYKYDDLVGQLLEVNDILISKLYEIFDIEISDKELMDFIQQNDVLFNNYSDFSEYQLKKHNIDEKFTELCIAYIESEMDINGYEISLSPIEESDETISFFEVEIYNHFTDVYLKCIVPYYDSNSINNEEADTLFFKKVYKIIKKVDKISGFCEKSIYSCSGSYGYGLELI